MKSMLSLTADGLVFLLALSAEVLEQENALVSMAHLIYSR